MTARPAARPAPAAPPAGAWLKLSAALTGQVPPIAGRADLVVTCAPGAGHGSPACFFPALAAIEVDGTHLGVAPGHRQPGQPGRPGTLPGHLGRPDPRMRPRRPHPLEPAARRGRRLGRGRPHARGIPHRNRADRPPPRRPPLAPRNHHPA